MEQMIAMKRKNKILVHKLGTAAALLALAACTPADEQYCQSYGVTGSEYTSCMGYAAQQQNAFSADRDVCDMQADLTYPASLYDYGRTEHIHGGFGYGGHYYGGTTISIPPDYSHNRQIDELRMHIIEPCMQAKGWNSGASWQAGRHAVTKTPKRTSGSQKLPWQR